MISKFVSCRVLFFLFKGVCVCIGSRRRKKKKQGHSLVSGLHLWARLRRAELGDGSVEQVDLVVEIDHVDGQPLVLVLALGQLHHLAQAAAAQRRLGILSQLVACVAALARAGAELVARALVAVYLDSIVSLGLLKKGGGFFRCKVFGGASGGRRELEAAKYYDRSIKSITYTVVINEVIFFSSLLKGLNRVSDGFAIVLWR